MDKERLAQQIQDYYQTETQSGMPENDWWDQRIAQLEERNRKSSRPGLIPRTRLAWLLLPLILLLIGSAVYGASTLFFKRPSNIPKEPGVYYVPGQEIYFDVLPDIVSGFADDVELKITLTNFDSETRRMLNFPPAITLESRNLPFEDRTVRTFPAGDEQIELQPNESIEYKLTWDQQDDSGLQLPYGWYEVRATVRSQRAKDSLGSQSANGRLTKILVLPQDGTMEQNLEVNQTQTVNGVNLSIEKLEIGPTGVSLFTFTSSDRYDADSYEPVDAEGRYQIDDGDWKPALKASFGTYKLEDGIRNIWDLDPVPVNSSAITIIIDRLNGWDGPWEFKIPLQ
jgi:hypothetical protein